MKISFFVGFRGIGSAHKVSETVDYFSVVEGDGKTFFGEKSKEGGIKASGRFKDDMVRGYKWKENEKVL